MQVLRWIGAAALVLLGAAAVMLALIAASRWLHTGPRDPLDAGWRADVVLAADGVTVDVADRRGAPLAGASVRVVGHCPAGGRSMAWVTVEGPPGRYRAASPPSAPGRWDLAVQVHHGDVAWTSHRVADAP